MSYHPLDLLQGYRIGNRQATVELQRSDAPAIRIDFNVELLVEDLKQESGQAVILTGTAGDGKTYLAFRIISALELDRQEVLKAQMQGGYDRDGIFIDLDLSAGPLDGPRVSRLQQVLGYPEKLTLVCANEGKLEELKEKFRDSGQILPKEVSLLNLSRRAIVSSAAWDKVLSGVLEAPLWNLKGEPWIDHLLSWNRLWLEDEGVKERVRCYLLVPYLLGEPITIRETLSCLAYALGGGRSSQDLIPAKPEDCSRYLLFNTLFSEPEGLIHGGRLKPSEKLLAWLFRFDPGDQASPGVDLKLLIKLNELEVDPPAELRAMWEKDLLVGEGKSAEPAYRQRLLRFMRYARRWYALATDTGFGAYFPFRYFEKYMQALSSPVEKIREEIPILIKGLNMLLSGAKETDRRELKLFYLPTANDQQNLTIFSRQHDISERDLRLEPDWSPLEKSSEGEGKYLERLPRRLILSYGSSPELRLPVSLMLYEVLHRVAGETGGVPTTLWAKERNTVLRVMGQLSRRITSPDPRREIFTIILGDGDNLELKFRPEFQEFSVG